MKRYLPECNESKRTTEEFSKDHHTGLGRLGNLSFFLPEFSLFLCLILFPSLFLPFSCSRTKIYTLPPSSRRERERKMALAYVNVRCASRKILSASSRFISRHSHCSLSLSHFFLFSFFKPTSFTKISLDVSLFPLPSAIHVGGESPSNCRL